MVSKYYQINTGLTVTNIYSFIIIIISVVINIMPQALFVDLKLNTQWCFKAHILKVWDHLESCWSLLHLIHFLSVWETYFTWKCIYYSFKSWKPFKTQFRSIQVDLKKHHYFYHVAPRCPAQSCLHLVASNNSHELCKWKGNKVQCPRGTLLYIHTHSRYFPL